MRHSRLSHYNQPLRCMECRRLCTDESTEAGLCRDCYERAVLEDEHSDYGHETPVANCPVCEKRAQKL